MRSCLPCFQSSKVQDNGYQTALVGKWHLKSRPSGFDYYNVLPEQGRYHDPILRDSSNRPAHLGIRTKRYKLIYFYGQPLRNGYDAATEPTREFYDLQNDPKELNNLYSSSEYRDEIKRLKAGLMQLNPHYSRVIKLGAFFHF